MCQNVPGLFHSHFIKLSLKITAQCSNSVFEVSQVQASRDSNWLLIYCISWHLAPHFWRFQSAADIWKLKSSLRCNLKTTNILVFLQPCIICVVVVQSWCLHGGGCCCFHFCSCCPFRCSRSELLAPFKLLSMMVVGGTSRGRQGLLMGN